MEENKSPSREKVLLVAAAGLGAVVLGSYYIHNKNSSASNKAIPNCEAGYTSRFKIARPAAFVIGNSDAYHKLEKRIIRFPEGSPLGVSRQDEINAFVQLSEPKSKGLLGDYRRPKNLQIHKITHK
jgi:hypothetical protein